MKKILGSILLLAMLMSFPACGIFNQHEGEVKTPAASSEQKGRNYQDVITTFRDRGFTNVKAEKNADLFLGWLAKDGEVEWVSVDGNKEYSADKWYPSDVEVIIMYHTFPEQKEPESSSEASKPIDNTPPSSSSEPASDRSSSGIEEIPPASSSEVNHPEEPESQPEELPEGAVLTIENCEALRRVLENKSDIDKMYAEFSEEYRGRTIQFNGYIANIANYSDWNPITGETKVYNTRYNILVYVGDYDPDHAYGPQFQFENIGSTSLPEPTKVGRNYVITAKVGVYNENSGLWGLLYDSMEPR